MSTMNEADKENKQRMHHLLLTLLLAVNFWCVNAADASEQTAAGETFMGSSILRHHCCRLEIENSGRQAADSENQTPCTCRSQADEKLRTAVSTGSYRWHPDKGNSLPLKDTFPAHTSVIPLFVGIITKDSIPIYLLNTSLLI
ncbi:MAG: hypothetical protein V2I56_04470 [Desulfobacteraceae bacterium]|jgi:hypothetical protein|nr:hypothetical protein [Desulfobacteraceae bacterium]